MSSTALNAPAPAPASGALARWSRRALAALPVLGLVASASMKLLGDPAKVGEMASHLGFAAEAMPRIGLVELAAAVLYVVPRTAVVGALVLTAYLGGATAAHVRLGEPFLAPVIVGILVWAGLAARDPRVVRFVFGAARA